MAQYSYFTNSLVLLAAVALFLAVAVQAKPSAARLRGKHFDVLEERARNPAIDETIRGKTLQELGVQNYSSQGRGESLKELGMQHYSSQDQSRRKAQGQFTMNFFSVRCVELCGFVTECAYRWSYPYSHILPFSLHSQYNTKQVYDEFGPSVSNMGDTAGLRGIVYNTDAKDNGLVEEFIDGALQGTCSVVSSDGKQLCNYEIFILTNENSIGTIVATGTVSMELGTTNLLIIEATGDDFVEYKGGMITITYTAIGDQTVMDLGITFRR